jgi:hypothetical protein
MLPGLATRRYLSTVPGSRYDQPMAIYWTIDYRKAK